MRFQKAAGTDRRGPFFLQDVEPDDRALLEPALRFVDGHGRRAHSDYDSTTHAKRAAPAPLPATPDGEVGGSPGSVAGGRARGDRAACASKPVPDPHGPRPRSAQAHRE